MSQELDNKLVALIKTDVIKMGVKYLSDKKVKIGGQIHYYSRFNKLVTKTKVASLIESADPLLKMYGTHEADLKVLSQTVGQEILDALEHRRAKQKAEDRENQVGFDYSGMEIAIDYITGEKHLYNKTLGRCISGCVDTWLTTIPPKEKQIMMETSIRGRLKYNPYQTENVYTTITDDGQEVPVFNTYSPAPWIIKYNKAKTYPTPADFTGFMEKFIVDEGCRKYVYFWLRNMLVSRNEDTLVLHGIEGAGKGLFVEIATRLVGLDNFFRTEQNFFNSMFNMEIADRRLVFFDELNMNGTRAKSTLKDMGNGRLNYTAKGRTPVNKDNYASMILANNDPRDCDIHQNDRRFSPVDMSQVNLKEQYGEGELDIFWDKVRTDDDFIQSIFNWLMQYSYKEKGWGTSFCWKGETYHRLCFTTLKEWERYVIESIEKTTDKFLIVSEISEDFKEYKGTLKTAFGGEYAVITLLSKYMRRDGTPFAKSIVKDGVQQLELPTGDTDDCFDI